MPSFSRRTLIARLAALAAMQSFRPFSLANSQQAEDNRTSAKQGSITVPITVNWEHVIAHIPNNMLGLSYESSQLAAPDFFSSANTELIELIRKLSPHGVLRLGGNLSEYTVWTPDLHETPQVLFRAVGADPSAGTTIPQAAVSRQAVVNLSEFLHQTGWNAIYGLNLAKATPARVAEEAQFVARTLGSRLIAFQIGNEPDHYVMNKLRNPGYSFEEYFAEWSKVHSAVVAAVPTARFAGPDIAEDVSWIRNFAKTAPKSVAMLTGHHYAEGPPSDPAVTVERLLSPDASFNHRIAETEEICQQAELPYVMAETNSCYKAGKEGVSDVFASALWAVDYFLQLASAGQQGVYFHGGANGWYTPIAGGSGEPFQARPIYYGLQMVSGFLGSEMAAIQYAADAPGVSIYALRKPRRLVVVNKGSTDAVVKLLNAPSEAHIRIAHVQRLYAPSPASRHEITLASDLHAHSTPLTIPGYSAAVFAVEHT